ncbi:hypothetical protein [Pedobacter sp.]
MNKLLINLRFSFITAALVMLLTRALPAGSEEPYTSRDSSYRRNDKKLE